MAALVSALDTKANSIQYGENNHIEYSWSHIQQEQLCQLFFQLVRTSCDSTKKNLRKRFINMFIEGDRSQKLILLKLLAHTRDIEQGKGEYTLSLELLSELYLIDKNIGINMLKHIVGFKYEDDKPYGSWKDIKYLLNICEKNFTGIEGKKYYKDIVNMYVDQIKYDIETGKSSLVCKWIPREGSNKFGWINKEISLLYFDEYGKYGWKDSAVKKAQMNLRKLISRQNRALDTTQIHQCEKSWKSINFNNVTSVTMLKQKQAFLNSKNKEDEDRVICAKNMLDYMNDVSNGKKIMKGKTIGIVDLVKQALYSKTHNDNCIINELWNTNSKLNKKLENMLVMVDTSGSMEAEKGDPLYSAIGLGCRIAEKSSLGKRVMTFNTKPEWINLDDCNNFVEMVNKIRNIPWGMNTNFISAIRLILDTVIEHKIPAEDVEQLCLVVLSDMQFDAAEKSDASILNKTVRQQLETLFEEAGKRICGKGYKVPHILFWNLRSTNGFPTLSYHEGYSMMSGYSPMLLNEFTECGINALEKCTPWSMLESTLNKKRYNKLEYILD